MPPTIDSLISDKDNLVRVLDTLKDGIIAHDLERRIFFFNREAEKITGFKREEVLGKDCHEVFGQPFCGERCSFCKPEPDFSEKCDYALNIVTRSGDPRRVEMSVTVIQDQDGRPAGALATIRDVTDLFCLRLKTGDMARFCNIIGRDSKMLQVFQQIRDVAPYDYPVHIFGETGTGKELVAMAIHEESSRGGAPFVPINCGALPEGLIESELFGHVKGAFSGAIREKKGRCALADGGTLFLDEIADLPKPVQVKLLRFLQEGTFEKVGGEKTLSVNTRVISATAKDLKQAVARGEFRDDLFYRLNVVPIILPPLRERRTDIPLLAQHFVEDAAKKNGEMPVTVSKEALSLMMDYHWPGNVRELQNAVLFAIVKCNGRVIRPGDLPFELVNLKRAVPRNAATRKLTASAVRAALERAGGNKARAARALNVGRATLYRFLSEHPNLVDAGQ